MLYNAFLFTLTITVKIISVCILTAKINQNFIKLSKLNCLQPGAMSMLLYKQTPLQVVNDILS